VNSRWRASVGGFFVQEKQELRFLIADHASKHLNLFYVLRAYFYFFNSGDDIILYIHMAFLTQACIGGL